MQQDFVERIAAEKPTNQLRWNDDVLEQLWDIQVTRTYTEDAAAGYRPTYHAKQEWRRVPWVFDSKATK